MSPHRTQTVSLGLLAAALLSSTSIAQMHKVEQPERVTRAVAVYEWTGPLNKPTAARLVPVSIFINGSLQDAGVYLARPAPFALQEGNVYFVQSAGQSLGTLDLEGARDIVSPVALADDNPLGSWYGYGRFQPPPPAVPLTALHPTAHPSVIVSSNDSDDAPHFIVRNQSDPASNTTKPTSTQPTETSDDSERPTLRRRDTAPDSSARKDKKQKPQGYVTGPGNSLNDDPDRPTLHHTEPGEEAGTPQLVGLPATMQQTAAVSDPANREPHVFTREWESPQERSQTLAALESLARLQVSAYLTRNDMRPIAATTAEMQPPPVLNAVTPTPPVADTVSDTKPTPTGSTAELPPAPGTFGTPSLHDRSDASASGSNATAPSTSAANPPASKHTLDRVPRTRSPRSALPTPLSLTDESLRSFELSYDGLPTFIYSAQTPVATGGPVYVTIVAQRLPTGELQVALRSTTDAGHLDRTPWLRFVDAVDPDWSHRADLLFELRGRSSRQFALYQLVTAQADQAFVTGLIE